MFLLLFNHYINSQTIFNILQLLIPFLGFGLIGFIDDFLIIIKKNNVGKTFPTDKSRNGDEYN